MKSQRDVQIHGTGLGSTLERVWGQRGVGTHWLAFLVSLRAKRLLEVDLAGCQLEVHTVGGGILGKTVWTTPSWQPRGDGDGAPVELKLPLSTEQVLLLDRLRNERGSIRLRLWIEVHLTGLARDETTLNGVRSAKADFEAEIEQGDWLQVLKEMAFEERMVFEVPVVAGRLPSALAKAGTSLKEARVAFRERRWVDVLTRCREVLEEIDHQSPLGAAPDFSKIDRAWTLTERLAAIATVVRHAAHRGAHGGGANAIEGDPDRDDAELVLMSTALVLKNAALH